MSSLKRVLFEKDIKHIDCARAAQMDKIEFSFVVNKKLMPMREQMEKICEYLKINPTDAWSDLELDLKLKNCPSKKKERLDKGIYKHSHFKTKMNEFNKLNKAMRVLGYKKYIDFYIDAIEWAAKRAETKLKKQEAKNGK